MTDKTDWQASLIEQRIAWGTTLCAMIIALLAAVQPQWFEFSFAAFSPTHKQDVTVQTPVQHQPTVAKTKTVPEQTTAVKTAPVKSTTIKTITQSTPVKSANAGVKKVVKTVNTVKKPASVTHLFYVQLGAFKEKPRAQGMADQLMRKGWSVKITHKKNGLHAVWIGPKSTKSDAEKLLRTIQSKLKKKGFIVQHNG